MQLGHRLLLCGWDECHLIPDTVQVKEVVNRFVGTLDAQHTVSLIIQELEVIGFAAQRQQDLCRVLLSFAFQQFGQVFQEDSACDHKVHAKVNGRTA